MKKFILFAALLGIAGHAHALGLVVCPDIVETKTVQIPTGGSATLTVIRHQKDVGKAEIECVITDEEAKIDFDPGNTAGNYGQVFIFGYDDNWTGLDYFADGQWQHFDSSNNAKASWSGTAQPFTLWLKTGAGKLCSISGGKSFYVELGYGWLDSSDVEDARSTFRGFIQRYGEQAFEEMVLGARLRARIAKQGTAVLHHEVCDPDVLW